MPTHSENAGDWHHSRWRMAGWGAAALLLLLPLSAMQFTDEVDWSLADFVVFGAMLAGAGGAYELAARTTSSRVYRAAVGVALTTAFILVWVNLAVGIIGGEGNPANLMFGGVLAVGIIGTIFSRCQPRGMVRALVATAIAQAAVAVIVLVTGLGVSGQPETGAILVLNGLFISLWLGSAWLFRRAAGDG
jgi:hypothetical protein